MGVMGQDFRLDHLALARDFQMLLLSALAMSTFLTMLSKGKAKLMLLSIFLITFLPIWLMAYLEGFLRPQFGGAMQYEYSFAWLLLGVALVGNTINLLVLNKEDYMNLGARKSAVPPKHISRNITSINVCPSTSISTFIWLKVLRILDIRPRW